MKYPQEYAGWPNKATYDTYINIRYNILDAEHDYLMHLVALGDFEEFMADVSSMFRPYVPGWVDEKDVWFEHLYHQFKKEIHDCGLFKDYVVMR